MDTHQPGSCRCLAETGAGLVNNGQTLVFDNATFDGTEFGEVASSTGNTPTGFVRGGALTQIDGTMIFNGNTRFANNSLSLHETSHPTSGKFLLSGGGSSLYVDEGLVRFNGEAVFENNKMDVEYSLSQAGNYYYAIPTSSGLAVHNNQGVIDFLDKAVFRNNVTTNTLNYFDANAGAVGVTMDSKVGGAVYNKNGILNFHKDSFFEDNVTQRGIGLDMPGCASGLLLEGGEVNFFQNATFKRNKVENLLASGGAVLVHQGTLNFYGKTFFEENHAITDTSYANGGALYIAAGGQVNLYSSAYFLNNAAEVNSSGTGLGGAVSIYGINSSLNIKLRQIGDEVVFMGNTNNGISNAIHFGWTTLIDGGIVNLEHVMGTDVYFYDPVTSGTTNTINIAINQTKCGTTHFINNTSNYHANTNVNKGFFQLENATFGGGTIAGTFQVGPSGTVSGFGTNVINAQTIDVNGILRPGYDVTKGIASYHGGSTLKLNGDTTFYAGSLYRPTLFASASPASLVTHGTGSLAVDPGAKIFLDFRPDDYMGASGYTLQTLAGFDTVKKAGFIDADYDKIAGDIIFNGLISDFFSVKPVFQTT